MTAMVAMAGAGNVLGGTDVEWLLPLLFVGTAKSWGGETVFKAQSCCQYKNRVCLALQARV